MNQQEIWKDVLGYEGLYKVSNLGRVVSKRKILKGWECVNGYWLYRLCKNGKTRQFSAHRLVAINFLPADLNRNYVNHIDGDKLNNNLDNLEWCTNSENIQHAYKIGLKKYNSNNRCLNRAICRDNFSRLVIDTRTGVYYSSIKEASIYSVFSYSALKAMLNGENPNKTSLKKV